MIQESIERLAELENPSTPFPGLRPFEFDESYLFFGRNDQSERLIEKLSRTHFLAVVGTSGSGKSSLVRAGLLPALIGGMMSEAGSVWRVALMRPGNDPIGNLAREFNSLDAFGSEEEENRGLQISITEATLRRGSLGLLEAVRQISMPSGENLLVVADQFEELFRVEVGAEKEDDENDKAAFVKLLLEASRQREMNIYVVLTMRSDYLGDCSQFWDLPEAINESQYLIPRLTLDQRRDAITGPIGVCGGKITPRLVNRLINDIGDNLDQLPILQHALMRTWDEWKKDHKPDEPVDFRHYEATGGMAEALSKHADEAYNELTEERQKVAEKIFKALTEKGADNREVRRPMLVSEICEVVDAKEPEVIAVIDKFRSEGRSFLVPRISNQLDAGSLVDISHESLIRIWKRLSDWVAEEAQSARQYQRLAETTRLYEEGKEGLLRDPGLQVALDWREKNNPNPAWARRYHPGLNNTSAGLNADRRQDLFEYAFSRVLQFLNKSQEEQAEQEWAERNRKQRELMQALELAKEQKLRAEADAKSSLKLRRLAVLMCFTALIAVLLMSYAIFQSGSAERSKNKAIESERSLRQYLYVSNMNLASKAFEDNDRKRGYELLNKSIPTSESPDDVRGFDWYFLWRLNHNELETYKGDLYTVSAVTFLSNGKVMTDIVRVKSHNIAAAAESAIQGRSDATHWVAFSPDGKMRATGGFWGTINLWDVKTGEPIQAIETSDHKISETNFPEISQLISDVYSLAFSPDSKTLASGDTKGVIKLWDTNPDYYSLDKKKPLKTLQQHTEIVLSLAFSPDGKTLASGGDDKTIKLWDVSTGNLLKSLQGHSDSVLSLTFSPDGKTLASSSKDKYIKFWDVSTGKLLKTLQGHLNSVSSISFSPDGNILASGGRDNYIKLWDVNTGNILKTLLGHSDSVLSVAFSPDGKTLASGGDDKIIKLWDVSKQAILSVKYPPEFLTNSYTLQAVAFSPDCKTLAVSNEDKTIKLWDISTGNLLKTLQGYLNSVSPITFSPDGNILASGDNGYIKLWDVNTGSLLKSLQGHSDLVLSLAFSPDGKTLASGGDDKTIKLWDVSTGSLLKSLQGHSDLVLSLAFSPDGKMLASGSADKTIKLWNVNTGEISKTLQGHLNSVSSITFSPDGNILASGSNDKYIKLWDAKTGQSLNTLQGHSGSVLSVTFSPDGKTLASGSADKTIKLWDIKTGQFLNTIQVYWDSVLSVTFSPDGKTLASGGDKTIRLFLAATDQEVAVQSGR